MKDLVEKVLEFIERRFPNEDHWMDGNCYWFAALLCARFNKQLKVYYDPIDGHFLAGNAEENIYFDWESAYCGYKNELYLFEKLAKEDPIWCSRLIRDCIM